MTKQPNHQGDPVATPGGASATQPGDPGAVSKSTPRAAPGTDTTGAGSSCLDYQTGGAGAPVVPPSFAGVAGHLAQLEQRLERIEADRHEPNIDGDD